MDYNICIILPICSRNMNYITLEDTHLFKNFFPSFIKYIDREHKYTTDVVTFNSSGGVPKGHPFIDREWNSIFIIKFYIFFL